MRNYSNSLVATSPQDTSIFGLGASTHKRVQAVFGLIRRGEMTSIKDRIRMFNQPSVADPVVAAEPSSNAVATSSSRTAGIVSANSSDEKKRVAVNPPVSAPITITTANDDASGAGASIAQRGDSSVQARIAAFAPSTSPKPTIETDAAADSPEPEPEVRSPSIRDRLAKFSAQPHPVSPATTSSERSRTKPVHGSLIVDTEHAPAQQNNT